jgi:hydrogenase expression/formation protein HypD
MKYSSEFRDPLVARKLADAIKVLAEESAGGMTFMEVCGTHTMAVYQHGLRSLLPPGIRLISGPGCPVCVTPIGYVDQAVALARRPGTSIATFGDMVRVPGSTSSLAREQAGGADIRIVYSPLDAVNLALRNPDRQIVFLGVGFETTAPTVACAILQAQKLDLQNFYVLASHRTIPVPMAALAADPDLRIDGFLCPAHVSAIIGADAYAPLARDFRVPCVVTGFEPLDILQGVEMLARQVMTGEAKVEIQYRRVVKPEGNLKAREVLHQVFRPGPARWRGLGLISDSGLLIREEFARFDAARQFPLPDAETEEPAGCQCGEVLKGKLAPRDCPLFRTACSPESPVGACMVSSEGACAAEYKYGP